MSKKVLTAEDILNESDSDSDLSDSDSPPPKPAPKKQILSSSNKVENKAIVVTPKKESKDEQNLQKEQITTQNKQEVIIQKVTEVFNEQPEVDDKYGNIQTSKSAGAEFTTRFRSGTTENIEKMGEESKDRFQQNNVDQSESDEEPNFDLTRRQSYRANQSEYVNKTSFQNKEVDPISPGITNMLLSPNGKGPNFEESQIDDAKLLRMIEQESDSDENDSQPGSQENQKQVKSNGSMVSEEDLLNRSLQSESDGDDAVEQSNFLRYASEKINQKFNVLEIVDKNERSFKQVAEKMVVQSSQLISVEIEASLQQRRLTHQKVFKKITEKFVQEQQPTCIAALEDYLAVGCSDGSVRLFDNTEQELKILFDKSTKNNPVTCIDMRRLKQDQNLFILCGHMKGQLSIYEVKGLKQVTQFQNNQSDNRIQTNLDVKFDHRKTVDELHKDQIVNAKFVGDFAREILIFSSDIQSLICSTQLIDSYVMFRSNCIVFSRTRIGPTYSMSPLILSTKIVQTIGLSDFTTNTAKELMAKKLKEVAENSKQEAEDALKPQIVAFGSLDEVYVSQIKPSVLALLSIKRPVYFQQGSVPYLDWGYALTPSFRDKAYPCLAIGWGNAIQLAVYKNKPEADKAQELPELHLDGFYICDQQTIDQIFFLSESLILIIVNKKDVRILYTQNFTPGVYDEELSSKAVNTKKIGQTGPLTDKDQIQINQYEQTKEKYSGPVSQYAERDSGYKIVDDDIQASNFEKHYQITSEQGPKMNFNLTICKNFGFNVTAFSNKNQFAQRNLIHWEEYLDLIRRTSPDFLKVLKAALDIFNGKMIGLAGLPDQKEQREQLMRERMKDLLKQNINACIDEFQKSGIINEKTLRVATEFCIRVGATDHIFGELFTIFSDAEVESLYFQNLDAFILSGKFKTVKIPHGILHRIITFYKAKDIQLLEQALLNINLTKYPGSEELRFMCEEDSLSSALIHVLTTHFQDENESDYTTCLSILCSLFNLMMRSKQKKNSEDVQGLFHYLDKYPTSIFELSQEDSAKITGEDKQAQFLIERKDKIDIEHSGTYIGYKILWVVKLYLEGKKFPQGNLSELRWRYYVMDIVRFLTNERFMQWFLDFDPESFFAILKKVFNDQEPYDFIVNQDKYIEKNQKENPFLEPTYAHQDILTIFEIKINKIIAAEKSSNDGKMNLKAEKLQNAFLFFLTQVSKNKKIQITKSLCLKIVREQIEFNKTLFRIAKNDPDIIPETRKLDKPLAIYTQLVKRNESDVISILVRYSAQLTPEEIQSLLDLAKNAPLFKLKIFLYQLQGDFQKCLTLFFQIKAIKSDVFAWLYEIQHTLGGNVSVQLDENVDNDENDDNFFDVKGVGSRITLNKMRELILKNILDFARMDSDKTVILCQQWFDEDYMMISDELKDNKELVYNFLTSVLKSTEDKIMNEYNQAVLINSQAHQISDKYKNVLLRLLEILAERKIKNFNKIIVDYVQRNYFPVDECLKIFEKKNIPEASAVLFRRKGKYKESIKLYIQTIVNLCVEKLIHTIFVEKNIKFEDPLCTNEHMTAFDNLVNQIIKICSKYGDRQTKQEMEDLWMYSIKSLFEVKTEVFKKQREMEEPDSDSDSSADREKHEEEMQFEKFILIRNQHFLQKMSEHVNLRSVIQFLEQCGHAMKYDDFRKTFEEKIQTELYFIQILNTAIKLVSKEVQIHSLEIVSDYSRGLKTKTKCDSCKMNLISKFDKQEIWLLSCQHIFHSRCIAKTEGQCSVCFNELDVIHSFQQLRKEGKKPARGGRESNEIEKTDVDNMLQKREDSLKHAKQMAQTQGPVKKRIESKEDKFIRLMNEYDSFVGKKYLGKVDFLMV